uniref:60S ribosomal protein L13 n=1 Tax=Cuerna arida TaxID=1464854 RepID=A0A1B6GT73_9HEMI
MGKGNNMIPNAHLHKKWEPMVKTWFDQPLKKAARQRKRAEKAARVAPRPTELLRPIVHCPGIRYNMKVRQGRGFSLQELRVAGINKHYARTIGIAVDHRRTNKSMESLQENVQRLKEYQSRLVLFPLNKKKPRKGEATLLQWKSAPRYSGPLMPIRNAKPSKKVVEEMKVTKKMNKFDPWRFNKRSKSYARRAGLRAKKEKKDVDIV